MNEDTSPTESIVADAAPCDCIRLMNEGLVRDGHNTRVVTSWLWNRDSGKHRTVVKIQTEVAQKKRGARPITLIPEFCPFCGKRYEAEMDGVE